LIVRNYIALILPDQQAECLDVMRVFYYAQNYRELL